MPPITTALQNPNSPLRILLKSLIPPKWLLEAIQNIPRDTTNNFEESCHKSVKYPSQQSTLNFAKNDDDKIYFSSLRLRMGLDPDCQAKLEYTFTIPENFERGNHFLAYQAIIKMVEDWISGCLKQQEGLQIYGPYHEHSGVSEENRRLIIKAFKFTMTSTDVLTPEKIKILLERLDTCWQKEFFPYIENPSAPQNILSINDINFAFDSLNKMSQKNLAIYNHALNDCIHRLMEEVEVHAESKLLTMIFKSAFMIFILTFIAQIVRFILQIILPQLRHHPYLTGLCSCIGIMIIGNIFNYPLPISFGCALGVFFAEASLQVCRKFSHHNSPLFMQTMLCGIIFSLLSMLEYMMPVVTMMFFINSSCAYYGGAILANLLWKIYLFFTAPL